jgi:acyl-CoA synthetase (AMP-forming)/AMP-acid ligase II
MLLGEIVEFSALKHPDKPALLYEDQVITFADLLARTRRLSNALLGVASPGDRVAVLAENRPEYIDLYYGVPMAKMGLTFLNYRLNPKELVKIVDDAGATVLVTETSYLDTVAQVLPGTPSVQHVIVMGGGGDHVHYDDFVGSAPDTAPDVEVHPDDLAWLIYTSGTTGMPKGAMLSHRNLLAAVNNSAITWEHDEDTVSLFPWPLCHVAGYSFPLSHLLGDPVVLMRSYDPEGFLAHIERYQVTSATGAPTMINMLLDHPRFDDFDVSTIKRLGYGAAPMPVEVLRRAMEKFPNARFGTGFGMTELSGNVMYLSSEAHERALAGHSDVLQSVGQPMRLSVVRVVDDDMNDVAVGDVGEIVVRGDQVLTGYWNRPEATEEAFFGGWFHTGDMGRWDAEGNLYIVDRKKDMIITGGENVYSREVEEVLYAHPAVGEAAIVGVPDLNWGENVVAVIQLRAGAEATESELIAHCKDNLASYKKPKRVVFVDELPKNAAGKILKRELRDRLRAETEDRTPAGSTS